MAAARTDVEVLEEGDIFFLYRPRVETDEVRSREDVQRFYMILAPEKPKRKFRLFVLGRKKLPEITPDTHPSERRNWALLTLVADKSEALRQELLAVEYPTETRGERRVGKATPVGEGKYQLLRHGDHTELAYVLELPKEPGQAQEEFEVKAEASYVVAVKNPEVSIPGFPPPKEPPAYPAALKGKFGDRRWIDVDDPALLDYPHTQLLLLGAHAKGVEEELGIRINEEEASLRTADIFRRLKLWYEREAVTPLLTGEFPAKEPPVIEEAPDRPREEVRRLPPEKSPSKGGKAGGKVAATRAPSAAAITKLLGGIDFPKNRPGIVAYAREHKNRMRNPEQALSVLRHIPARKYMSMADVAAGLGEVR